MHILLYLPPSLYSFLYSKFLERILYTCFLHSPNWFQPFLLCWKALCSSQNWHTIFPIHCSLFCPSFTWPISNTWHCWLLTPWNLLFLWLPCFHSPCFSSFIIQCQVSSGAPSPCLSLKFNHYLGFLFWPHLSLHGFTYHVYVNETQVDISSPERSPKFWALNPTGCQCLLYTDVTQIPQPQQTIT